MQRCLSLFAVAALLSAASPVIADDYAEARGRLVAAYQAQDFPTMVVAAQEAMDARPGYPGASFNLALAYALNDEPEASLQTLQDLLRKGIDFGVGDLDEFAALRETEGWATYARAVAELREPRGAAGVFASHDDGAFVPEGIAIDDGGNLFLGSIRKGIITKNGEILSDRQGHWSVFGMRFHGDGSLWFASAAVPQLSDVGDDVGKTGLFRLDVHSGEITRTAILPQHAANQVLGDLVIDGDTIYTTDSLTGAVYRYDIDKGEFSALAERGSFGSPQGLVLDEDRAFLYVADYIGGLYRLRLSDGSRERLAVPDSASDFGIDGLYRDGNRLVAIQNGIRPHRVTVFELDEGGSSIERAETIAANLPDFDEPTLGAVRDGKFYMVANSHWNRFDAQNRLQDGLSGPIVLMLGLDPE